MEIERALRDAVAERVGGERSEAWFGSETRMVVAGESLVVFAANRFYRDWIRRQFAGDLQAVAGQVLGRDMSLEFRVDESLANGDGASAPQELAAEPKKKPATVPATNGATAKLRGRRFANLDSFVVGSSNRMAQSAVRTACEQPGTYSPLLLYGPTGVGKTHLLEAAWTEVHRRRKGLQALFLTAEQFTTFFLQALRGSGTPSFRRKYRGTDVLIIDDIQFFEGKKSTLTELAHTIDTLLAEGRQIVLAADRSPAELGGLGRELTTRLEGGMSCRLLPPDYETRLGIVGRQAAKQGIELPADVQEFVAAKLTSHARELVGAVLRLRATSEAMEKPITLGLAEEALAELIAHSKPRLGLADIQKAVCEVFGLEPESLSSNRKAKSVSYPRMLAMWLARKHTRAALVEIGHFFGRKSHTTVISAARKMERWVSEKETWKLPERNWHVEEAIRRVEETMRVG